MPRVFKIVPKKTRKINGTVLTPDMTVTVTTRYYMPDPFCNGGIEEAEAYMQMYDFDFWQAACQKSDFECYPLE